MIQRTRPLLHATPSSRATPSSLSLFLPLSKVASAADLEEGRRAATHCAICHGINGEGNGAPKSKISGMEIEVFKKRVNDYKCGEIKNVMMERFTKHLSDEDIENLAAYYATK
ncbi:MAG: c-type cytochrome [Gammaproteobacteria bacterium]|jgi:cytochrome c553